RRLGLLGPAATVRRQLVEAEFPELLRACGTGQPIESVNVAGAADPLPPASPMSPPAPLNLRLLGLGLLGAAALLGGLTTLPLLRGRAWRAGLGLALIGVVAVLAGWGWGRGDPAPRAAGRATASSPEPELPV